MKIKTSTKEFRFTLKLESIFKDELKKNSKGTEWIIDDIQFDVDIPDKLFSKSNLTK